MTAVHLYAGPDIDSALERTQLSSWLRERSAPSSLRLPAALESLLLDVMNKPTTRLRPTAAIVTGRERTSGATMRILFQGQLRSVDFCAEHILGSADFEVAPVSRPPYPACDIAVTDHPLLDRGLSGRKPALQVPQWLRQLRDLGPSWHQTVATIPTPLTSTSTS